ISISNKSKMSLATTLIEKGFLKNVKIKEDTILILTTPCRVKILKDEVAMLKSHYLDDEEIGGLMQAKPTIVNSERVFIVDAVKFIRNAIEDVPIKDKITGEILTKKDAYLFDAI